MTANQLIAYNLRRARDRAGLTQEQAAERLEPLLGRRWSKATFSAAETSVTSGRVREFSANEILAFSAAFGVPVGWFFLPPPTTDPAAEPVTSGGTETFDNDRLIDAVVPAEPSTAITERLIELQAWLVGPAKARPEGMERYIAEFEARTQAAVEDLFKRNIDELVRMAKGEDESDD